MSRQLKLMLTSFGLTTFAWTLYVCASAFSAHWLVVVFTKVLICLTICFNLIFYKFCKRKNVKLHHAALSMAIMIFVAMFVTDIIAGISYSREKNIWVFFHSDEKTGWHPMENLHDFQAYGGKGKDNMPYKVSTNALGYREHLPYPTNKIIPYMFQGDSNLFGFGLEKGELLCDRIVEFSGRKEFYNFGVSGFDINNFYYQYQRETKRFKFKNRVIFFNIGNDFTCTALSTPYATRRPYIMVEDKKIEYNRHNLNDLPVMAYGYHFVNAYKKFDRKIAKPSIDWANVFPYWMCSRPSGRFMIETFYRTFTKLGNSVSKRISGTPLIGETDHQYPRWLLLKQNKWPEPFLKFSEDFKVIMSEVKKQNQNLTIMLYPMKSQIIRGDVAEAMRKEKKHGYTDSDFDRFSFNKYMKKLCNELDIHFIDVSPDFVEHKAPESLFFKKDVHINAKGMALCAKVFLREMSIVKLKPENSSIQ